MHKPQEIALATRLAPARARVPAWVAMGSVLAFAWGFRYLGVFAADQIPESEGPAGRLVFAGVALGAAGAAAVVGRIWSTATGAVVMGVLGGLAATRFEDSIPGALLGLVVGVLVATSTAWMISRWVLGHAVTVGFGGLVGAGASACMFTGTWLGAARAAGVVVAGALCVAAFQPDPRRAPPGSGYRRWRHRLLLVGSAAAGAWWFGGPLARWMGV